MDLPPVPAWERSAWRLAAALAHRARADRRRGGVCRRPAFQDATRSRAGWRRSRLPQGWPRAGKRERSDRRACLVPTILGCSRYDDIVALSFEGSREPVTACGAGTGGRPAPGRPGCAAVEPRSRSALENAGFARRQDRCRFAALRKCMAPRTRSRTPSSTTRSSSTRPPTARGRHRNELDRIDRQLPHPRPRDRP